MFATTKVREDHTADDWPTSTAWANGLTLYTRNPGDLSGLEEVVTVVAV